MSNEKYSLVTEKYRDNVSKFFGEEHAADIDTSGKQKKPFQKTTNVEKIRIDLLKNPLTDKEKRRLAKGLNVNNKTCYKGVCFEPQMFKDQKATNKYCADFTFRKCHIKIKRRDTAEEAAYAWNCLIIYLFGDHTNMDEVYLNKLPEHSKAKDWFYE